MAIEVDGKIYRNLPEQVEENANQIEDLKTLFSTLGTVMVYKGSVATYADLPTEDQKVGDVYNVLDTGNNYAWDGEGWDEIGSTVDLSNVVDLDSAQTLTGVKTFSNGFNTEKIYSISNYFTFKATIGGLEATLLTIEADKIYAPSNNADLGSTTSKFKNLYLSGDLRSYVSGTNNYYTLYGKTNGTYTFTYNGSDILALHPNYLFPYADNAFDLGSSSKRFKDIYLSGQVIGASNVFNVINASDIVNNTLTQEQYDLMTNGKPTLIMGAGFVGLKGSAIFCPANDPQYNSYDGLVIGQAGTYSSFNLRAYSINKNTRVVTLFSGNDFDLAFVRSAGGKTFFNNKKIPDYPANTGTFVLKCIDGTLTWVQE